jgi:hypothetical protein
VVTESEIFYGMIRDDDRPCATPDAAGRGKNSPADATSAHHRRQVAQAASYAFPNRQPLRPTPDRVRGTLFNWLGQRLDGLACLDLFAGSGALGFEALSRGAARVVMVEASRESARNLSDNALALGGNRSRDRPRRRALVPRADGGILRCGIPRPAVRFGPRRARTPFAGAAHQARRARLRRERFTPLRACAMARGSRGPGRSGTLCLIGAADP